MSCDSRFRDRPKDYEVFVFLYTEFFPAPALSLANSRLGAGHFVSLISREGWVEVGITFAEEIRNRL
jgi:hypothetical protein